MPRPQRLHARPPAMSLAALIARLLHPHPTPAPVAVGSPAPAAGPGWLALRDALRDFRTGGPCRVQLVSLARALRNCQTEDALCFLPRLLELATSFRAHTLPQLSAIAALAASEAWPTERARRFASDGAQLGRLADDLVPGARPSCALLTAAEDSLRMLTAELRALQQQVDAVIAGSTEQLPAQLSQAFAGRGLRALLILEGDWQRPALLANPDEFAAMLDLLARFHRERLRGQAPRLRLRAQLEADQLFLASRDQATGPAPAEKDLERFGLRALAARLHCGLRCRAGEVQLAFPLAARSATAAGAPG